MSDRNERASNLHSGYVYTPAHYGVLVQMIRGLRGSQRHLPYRAARTHLGTMGELECLRLHSAGSTFPHLWPTGSQFG
ncbi:MAG: hypothetical protein KGZ79_13265 [Dethiobacter sp.]|nr:hypothetical protein [Dethiobacter sp.]